MRSSPTSRRRRPAFTLVELLIVIGIIAVLLSILLPVLGSVRSAGRSVACQSNLRSLTTGLLLYAQDNRQYLPYHFNGNDAAAAAVGEFEGNMNWYERLQKGRYGNGKHPYLDIDAERLEESPYACPFRGEIEAEGDNALFLDDNRSQYSFNHYLYGRRNADGSFTTRPVVRLTQAKGGTLAFSDAAFFRQDGQLRFRDEFNETWGNGGTVNGPNPTGASPRTFGPARTPWPVSPQDGTIRNGWHGGHVNASTTDGGVEKFERWGTLREQGTGPTPFERRIVPKFQ